MPVERDARIFALRVLAIGLAVKPVRARAASSVVQLDVVESRGARRQIAELEAEPVARLSIAQDFCGAFGVLKRVHTLARQHRDAARVREAREQAMQTLSRVLDSLEIPVLVFDADASHVDANACAVRQFPFLAAPRTTIGAPWLLQMAAAKMS